MGKKVFVVETFVDAAYFAAARVADLASNVDRHHVATMPYSHRDGVKKRNRDPDRELDSLTKVLSMLAVGLDLTRLEKGSVVDTLD